jgi:Smg protein
VRAGFHQDEIYKALSWLEKLAALQETDIKPYLVKGPTSFVTRIYTQEEEMRLDLECRGFLIFLEHINVLDSTTREMVIDRVMEIDSKEFCLEDMKWVVLMVLFNVPGKENAYAQMEDLLFEEPEGPLH